jgi:hypothetical protein
MQGEYDAVVLNHPSTPLPDATVRKLSPEVNTLRQMHMRTKDLETKITNPTAKKELQRQVVGEKKLKAAKEAAWVKYVTDPTVQNEPEVLAYWQGTEEKAAKTEGKKAERDRKLAQVQELKRVREQKRMVYEAEHKPGTEAFRVRVRRETYSRAHEAGSRHEFQKEYEKYNPHDPLVKEKRLEKQKRRQAATKANRKRGINRAAHMAKSVFQTMIATIVGSIVAGIGLLNKIYQVATKLGEDVERRALQSEKYNFSREFVKQWEIIAKNGHLDPNVLYNAAGAIQRMFGSSLHLLNFS